MSQALDKLIADAIEHRSTVILSASPFDVAFETRIVNQSESHILLINKVPPEMIRSFLDCKEFHLQIGMKRLTADTISNDGYRLLFKKSSLKQIEETRSTERYSFDSGEKVVCKFPNPYDPSTTLEKPVLDMSTDGISIATSRLSKLFRPNTHFSEMQVLINGEPYSRLSGTVVYARRLMGFDGKIKVQVGFTLDK